MNKGKLKWTKETVLAEANRYDSKIQWVKGSPNSYYKAKTNKWIEEASAHMKRPVSSRLKWTKETVLAEANKYTHKKEWENKSPSSINAARKNKWIEEASAHMKRPAVYNKKWTKETVLKEALKYRSKSEWALNSGGSHLAAHRMSIVIDVTAHMLSHRGACVGETEILQLVRQYFPRAASKRFRNTYNCFSFKRLELDVYIPEINKGIEFDGEYWHSSSTLRKHRKNWTDYEIENYHEVKDLFFRKIGIEVLHIAENTWNSSKKSCFEAILMFIGVI